VIRARRRFAGRVIQCISGKQKYTKQGIKEIIILKKIFMKFIMKM
jgi:hypothetical protein